MTQQRLKGTFFGGTIEGLEYKTKSFSGKTNRRGEYSYLPGETITFHIGGLVLGSARASSKLTTADLVLEVSGDINKITNQRVTNVTRFLLTMSKDSNVENGVAISENFKAFVDKLAVDINFDKSEAAFSTDPFIKTFCGAFGLTLMSAPRARNHLRRIMRGIKKQTDIKIPTRDGSYLLADVFMPIGKGKFPIIISLGAYGKAFLRGTICNDEDLLMHEDWEDKYFEGNPIMTPMGMKQLAECWEIANTVDWVPDGYAVIRVDGRGVGNTPGFYQQFSLQEAKDYYDAIEWAAKQPWSNGKVGIWGSSYYAMDQYNVAQLQPPSLKAMIPTSGDVDSYRDYIYPSGGIFNTFNFVSKTVNGKWHGVDWVSVALKHPFYDPKIYGPKGNLCISPDMKKIITPIWVGMGIESQIHTRGCSEAFIHAASKNKKIKIISDAPGHGWVYRKEYLKEHKAFFDYWLKGIKNGIMEKPPVEIQMRTGNGNYFWQNEDEWPVKETKYIKYYLDATPSDYAGDSMRKDDMRLIGNLPVKERSKEYSGEAHWGTVPAYSYGITFVTEPLAEDMALAGYLKLVLWVSSTTHDMELHTQVRVIDENNQDVTYSINPNPYSAKYPVSQGGLKVSHRKLDPVKSTVYRPFHTHLKKDYQPLKPDEVVEAEVELWPTTAVIKKGHRIRLFIQPALGPGLNLFGFDVVDRTYQRGSKNTVYTGPKHISYLQLPVIPVKK